MGRTNLHTYWRKRYLFVKKTRCFPPPPHFDTVGQPLPLICTKLPYFVNLNRHKCATTGIPIFSRFWVTHAKITAKFVGETYTWMSQQTLGSLLRVDRGLMIKGGLGHILDIWKCMTLLFHLIIFYPNQYMRLREVLT